MPLTEDSQEADGKPGWRSRRKTCAIPVLTNASAYLIQYLSRAPQECAPEFDWISYHILSCEDMSGELYLEVLDHGKVVLGAQRRSQKPAAFDLALETHPLIDIFRRPSHLLIGQLQ